jgi:AraC-like DNA-binding protein
MDALAEVLQLSRITGCVLARVRAHEPWGIQLAPVRGAAVHAITAGTCWLRIAGDAPRRLMPGDVVLLPSGSPHALISAADGPTRTFDQVTKEQLLTPDGDLVVSGPGAATCFLCATYSYDHEVTQPLLSLLPPVLHIAASDREGDSPVQSTLRLLSAELGRRGVGTRTVVDRLIDVLFVHVVRQWLDRGESDATASWIRGLRDPAIAKVLAVLHGRPAEPWTLESIAQEAHLSRSTLARRFSDRVGEPPLAYLTRWRMDLAARLLRETDEAVGEVGRRVGYESEFAFSRAFTRVRGVAPGRYRRSHRANTQRAS